MAKVGYISSFVPPEWIEAHGHQPERWMPTSAATLTAGVCPLAAAFRATPDRQVGYDALILTTTCDQMRRVADELVEAADPPSFALNVPATWQTPQARDLYRAELARLGRFLVTLGGRSPSPALLAATMRQTAARRSAVCVRPRPIEGRPRLAILGAALRHADQGILDFIAALGATLVLDATETGHRGLPASFDEESLRADPFAELARAYFDAIPDAFRRPDTLLYDYLRRELATRHVQGLLLVRYTWCDLWHAQLSRLKEAFPMPIVEIELGSAGDQPQRTRTRVEALVEALR